MGRTLLAPLQLEAQGPTGQKVRGRADLDQGTGWSQQDKCHLMEQGKNPFQIMPFCLPSLYVMQEQPNSCEKCFISHQLWCIGWWVLLIIQTPAFITGRFVWVHIDKNAQLSVLLLDFPFYMTPFVQWEFIQQGLHTGRLSPATSCPCLLTGLGICGQNGKGECILTSL